MRTGQSDILPRYGDGRKLKIGLLGGSFNPAHDGHLTVARHALRTLGLDQVWFLVSPGNPLKKRSDQAPIEERFKTIEILAAGDKRLRPTMIEERLGTRFTFDGLRRLKRVFPNASFVWLMGADNLAQFPAWRRWRDIADLMPIAVFARPGSGLRVLRSQAASYLRRRRRRPGALTIANNKPHWAFVPTTHNFLSSTAIRRKIKKVS